MKAIIKNVDYKNKSFSIVLNNKIINYYLTKRLSKLFLLSLKEGYLIDFEYTSKVRKYNNKKYYQVLNISLIKNLNMNYDIYNHNALKQDMVNFLISNEYYLFLDLEMTFPFMRQKNFKHEIVQYGYFLVDKNSNTLLSNGNYVETKLQNPVSKRTFNFLSIKKEEYELNKISYERFYLELKNIIKKYNPKIVIWGKNDILALDLSYQINNFNPITTSNDFVDLLKLHKDYFNLINDVGLFKAYESYYDKEIVQLHDAKDDAKVTKEVFLAFLDHIRNNKEFNS